MRNCNSNNYINLKSIFFVALMSIVFISSCKKDKEVVGGTFISVAPNTIKASYKPDILKFTATSQGTPWRLIVPDNDWVEFSQLSGGSTDTTIYVKLDIKENFDTASREIEVTMQSTKDESTKKTLKITQDGRPLNYQFSPETINALSTGGVFNVTVRSNVTWEIESASSWIKAEEIVPSSKALEVNRTIKVTVDQFTDLNFRTGVIKFKDTNTEQAFSGVLNVFQEGTATAATDKAALMSLYNAAGGASWSKKWDTSGSMSSWLGVTTATINGQERVVELRLPNNNLVGSIAPEISNLSYLKVLELNNNSLSGVIPQGIVDLVKLEYLYLHKNQLSGEIPALIGNLTSLWRLNLNNNRLTGSVPASLGAILPLNVLTLNDNMLTGEFPAVIGTLPNLQYFYLQNNSIVGEVPQTYKKNIYWRQWVMTPQN